MSRAPTTTRAEWKPRRATETEPKLERADRASRSWVLWLLMAGAGLGMGLGAEDGKVVVLALAALAVAVTLWVREWREVRR
jgi:hypothetical protein